tara:strand:- start:8088 stop:9305 length:1218 start_codon:yes stop_codon:yes gene_type:complete
VKKNQKIIYKNFIQQKFLLSKNKKIIDKNFSRTFNHIYKNLDSSKDAFNSLSNKFKFNFKTIDLNRFRKFKTVVIIGMGGSILGAEAIYSFLKSKIKKNFLFLDNIDENKLNIIKKTKKLNQTLFIIISKSGNTIETLANVCALKIIKKRSKNIIIISEKRQNQLYSLAKKMDLFYVEHKKYIGGRYSVLTEVGMVPAYLMGINISKFRKNLLKHFKDSNKNFLKDSSIKLAKIINNKKLNNVVFFNYIPQLNKFLYWSQQLIAESLGKKGRGFLPIISPAPKDHHSLLQLYLDGPKDKLFYIFSSEIEKKTRINSNNLDKRFNFINKGLGKIKVAQKESFVQSLKKKKIPFREFRIRDLSEQTLGELFSYFLLETAIVGKLVNVNPFDQPAVEEVKINTAKTLL